MSISSNRCRSSFSAYALGRRGFTLIELMVVVAVITIITAVVLFSQSKFDSATLLRSLGYSVALSVSQAQIYGTSVRGTSGSINFAPSYGVYIDQNNLSLSPQQYYIFADNNFNGVYDVGEGLPAELLPKGYTISKFCAVTTSGQDCYPSGGTSLTSLTIYFKRPNPDACIESSANPSACTSGGTAVYTGAYIEVKATGGSDFRAVKVTTTGQITVCALDVEPPTC